MATLNISLDISGQAQTDLNTILIPAVIARLQASGINTTEMSNTDLATNALVIFLREVYINARISTQETANATALTNETSDAGNDALAGINAGA
jgi:hypothetical protein